MNLEDISQLKAIPLTFVACNAIGILLKRSPVQNWMIPWVLLGLGMALYPFICDPSQVPYNVRSPLVHSLVLGALIGLGSVGGHQTLITFLRPPEDGGTTFLKRQKETPDPVATPPMSREPVAATPPPAAQTSPPANPPNPH